MSLHVGVLVDRHDPSRGGMESALVALIVHLLDRGHRVDVYGLSAADGAPGVFHGIDPGRLRRGELERVLAERFRDAAREAGCDVTLAVRHAPEVDVLWPHGGAHRATLAAGERARGAVAGTVSRLLHRWSPRHRAFLELERSALRGGARRLWCVSRMVQDELVAAHPGCTERLELHPNGVDRERFHTGLRALHRAVVRPRWGVAPDAPVMLFPGGNLRLKGWHVLLDALARITDRDWTCAAAGVWGAAVARDVRAAGLERRVLLLPLQDMPQALGAVDVVVQPTFRDPCSLSTLESLSAGVPVVTTDANGAAEALGEPAAGTVVPAGDPVALAEALRERLASVADDTTRARCSAAARAATQGREAAAWLEGLEASLAQAAG